MHKRIFFKYYGICVIIVFVTVSLLGFATSAVLGVQTITSQSENMERAANKLAHTVAELPKNYSIIAGNIFNNSISTIKDTLDSEIFVFDGSGKLQLSTMSIYETSTKNFLTQKEIDSVLGGNVYKRARSFGKRETSVGYTVGVPIFVNDNQIAGAVFISSYELNLRAMFAKTFVTFAICGIAVLFIAFIVLIFLTHKMTKPINQMYDAANQYAKGDFSKRLNVSNNNEYAPLVSAFNSMADGIENLDQMRKGFIADVSHELRTPMTTITGFVDGVLDGTIPPEQQTKYLKTVSDEAHRMSRLISTMLDVAKMQSGQITFVKKPFDIVATTGKVLFGFEEKFEQNNINVDFKYQNDSIIAVADEDAIYRVIYNLLDNAVKFTNQNGKITVCADIVDNKVRMSVFNTGCGISKEDAANIFEKFYKADKSRALNKKGTGIGLFLVKNILNAHNEDIILTSKEGEYANFTFMLPLYKD